MKLRSIILGCFFFLVTAAASAQELATIVGTVTDATGASVPAANIKVSNPTKGFTRTYVSNSAGEYTAARIPLGDYTVTAEVTGFQTLTRSGITLDAGQTLRVDMQLKVGTTREEVTVVGNLPRVETETGAISNVITGTQISELNIQARNFSNLALLVPGAAPGYNWDTTDVSGEIGDQYLPINGIPGNMLGWEIDGASDADISSGSDSLQVFPSLDLIAEFRVSTSNYSAEFARAGGAMFEIATKSGTSTFHGSAFEFVRNSALDSNDWFLNQTIAPPGGNAAKQPIKHNDFGFTIGGPFYIPDHYNTSKQKTFFFVSEQWRYNRDGAVISHGVPTLRERGGDFSECDSSSPNYNAAVASGCKLPKNLATGTTYTNDLVPVSPIATTLLNAWVPLPNNGPNGYRTAPNQPFNFREDSVRVDQNITNNVRLFVRITQDLSNETSVPPQYSGGNFPTAKTFQNFPNRNEVLNLTYSIRPNLLNELSLAYTSMIDKSYTLPGIDSVSGSILYPSGLQIGSMFPAASSGISPIGKVLPGINVSGGGPGFAQSEAQPSIFWDSAPFIKDNVVWTKGKHTFKFGGYIRDSRLNNTIPEGGSLSEGTLYFRNSGTLTTGNALADMDLGTLYEFKQTGRTINGQLVGGFALGHYRQRDYEPYFQDDWRVTRRLTLNLGFRYYYVTAFKDITNPIGSSIFVPGQYNSSNQAQFNASAALVPSTGDTWLSGGNGLDICGAGSIPGGCITLPHGTPSPRFGFAWDPTGSGKTAIRGGYGLIWDTSNAHMTSAGRYGDVPVMATLAQYYLSNWGYPTVAPPGTLPVASTYSQPQNQHLPEIDQYSLTVEHEFPGNSLLSVSYVGTLGRHLQRERNINQVLDAQTTQNVPALAGTTDCDALGNCDVQSSLINSVHSANFFRPYRGFGSIDQMEASGVSNYNSLQVNFRHNIGHGLTFQSVYTWAHELDDLIGAGGSNESTTDDDYNLRRWYGTSADNQAQVLVMNYVYKIPFFGHSTNHFIRGSLGGWQFGGMTSFETGPPLRVGCGIAGKSSGVGGGVMCNSLGKVQVQKGVINDPTYGPMASWFDPSTIGQITVPQLSANNQPGMFGYMGKDAMRGPGRNNWDLSLIKNMELPWFHDEHATLQFRWETFNTFNHPQWNSVSLFCSSSTPAGQPCNGANNVGNGEVSGDFGPRIMQLGLRLVF
jgi:hypothetical protein